MEGIYIFGLLFIISLISVICCVECINDADKRPDPIQYHRV